MIVNLDDDIDDDLPSEREEEPVHPLMDLDSFLKAQQTKKKIKKANDEKEVEIRRKARITKREAKEEKRRKKAEKLENDRIRKENWRQGLAKFGGEK